MSEEVKEKDKQWNRMVLKVTLIVSVSIFSFFPILTNNDKDFKIKILMNPHASLVLKKYKKQNKCDMNKLVLN